MRYSIKRDLNVPLVPSFHIQEERGGLVFVTTPAEVALPAAGDYSAECDIPPFALNSGRYSVSLQLNSYAGTAHVHFDARNALRFEVTEEANSDPRRHGWMGPVSGITRPRLTWRFERDESISARSKCNMEAQRAWAEP
jgi:hypothetical protein